MGVNRGEGKVAGQVVEESGGGSWKTSSLRNKQPRVRSSPPPRAAPSSSSPACELMFGVQGGGQEDTPVLVAGCQPSEATARGKVRVGGGRQWVGVGDGGGASISSDSSVISSSPSHHPTCWQLSSVITLPSSHLLAAFISHHPPLILTAALISHRRILYVLRAARL